MSRDPEDGRKWDPKTLHKYLYAGVNPVNAFDPSGRFEILEEGAIDEDFVLEKVPGIVKIGCAVEFFIYLDVELVNYLYDRVAGFEPYEPLPHIPSIVCGLVTAGSALSDLEEGTEELLEE